MNLGLGLLLVSRKENEMQHKHTTVHYRRVPRFYDYEENWIRFPFLCWFLYQLRYDKWFIPEILLGTLVVYALMFIAAYGG